MFREALQAVSLLNEEKITTKLEFLKRMFGWSDAELSHAVSKAPVLLRRPEEALRRRSEFLISEVGLKPAYIAHRPVIISYSMEGRLRPRYYVLRFLKANGLPDQNQDYYNTIVLSEMAFVEKFICPHKESAPDLAEDYATICKGEVPTNFRPT
jgi:mTERF domain-containing protein